ncbi:C40 family peptidase [Brevibacterium luteolum]|uniref:C40 family peptidase n=1 Tax=Brevibacterium luteolum TaxID=199591 RepID=UPI00223B24CE|nr:C40 family peptidase [Brevibacterium luteolum]MCT1830249.1 NlpC/P60 family protein [Brevibacterium luteolum]
MAVKTRGRRRADGPAKTPLTELTDVLAANSGAVGRRAAVVAAAGGLMAAVALPTANSAAEADGKVVAQDSEVDEAPEFVNQASVTAPDAEDGSDALKTSTADIETGSAKAAPSPEPTQTSAPTQTRDSGSASRDSGAASRDSDRSSKNSDDVKMPSGSKAQQVIGLAKQYSGIPYKWGGTTTAGFDCSGFTSFIYGKVGVSLPRTSGAQKSAGTIVSKSEAKPGDLIWAPGHVGIYAGNGMMYDAPSSGKTTGYHSADWMMKRGAVFVRVL